MLDLTHIAAGGRSETILRLAFPLLLFTALYAVTAGLAPAADVEWTYGGETGPSSWGDLDESFAQCSDGTNQSPIDIAPLQTREIFTAGVSTDYEATPLVVVNNGHTIEVEYEPGSFLVADGRVFEVVQFHFHAPSEHTFLMGARFPMEMHVVHRTATGGLAVVAALVREGSANEALAPVWDVLPSEPGEQSFPDVAVNIDDVLPANLSAFRYRGSLTTPPCSEGVQWIVLQTPIEMSAEQIAHFKQALAESCCEANARPTQPLNSRNHPSRPTQASWR